MASARMSIMGTRHVISAGHYLAAHAGFQILGGGGNAIDAGVAAGIAIGVLQTDKVNFGGVAPQIIYPAKDRKVHCIDGLGVWPKAITPDYFQKKHGGKIPPGVERSVVPAAPDAWLTALEQFGTMSFGEVASAAIRFASDGFPMHPLMTEFITEEPDSYERWPSSRKVFLPKGRPPEVGRSVRAVGSRQDAPVHGRRRAQGRGARKGARPASEAARNAFYKGDIAREVTRFIEKEGGLDAHGGFRVLRGELRADGAHALPRHGAPRLRAVVAGSGDADGAQHPQELRLESDGAQLARLHPRRDRSAQARVRRPPQPFRRSEVREGADEGPDVGRVREMAPLAHQHREGVGRDAAGGRSAHAARRSRIAGCPSRNRTKRRDPATRRTCASSTKTATRSRARRAMAPTTRRSFRASAFCARGAARNRGPIPTHPCSVAPGKRPRLTPSPALAFKGGKVFMPFGTPGGDVQPQAMLQVFLNVNVFGMDRAERDRCAAVRQLQLPGVVRAARIFSCASVHREHRRGFHSRGAGDTRPQGLRVAGVDLARRRGVHDRRGSQERRAARWRGLAASGVRARLVSQEE